MSGMKRLPVVATLIMLIAVGIMVRLGFWQLDRMHQKDALLVRYADAARYSGDVLPAQFGGPRDTILYRQTAFTCTSPDTPSGIAGLSATGASGIAHVVRCHVASGGTDVPVFVTLGWSTNPAAPVYTGGPVTGMIAPMGKAAIRVVADPPLAGLNASARRDPADLPNNHLSYAVQWFAFALTALVIFGLALRKRLAAPGTGR